VVQIKKDVEKARAILKKPFAGARDVG